MTAILSNLSQTGSLSPPSNACLQGVSTVDCRGASKRLGALGTGVDGFVGLATAFGAAAGGSGEVASGFGAAAGDGFAAGDFGAAVGDGLVAGSLVVAGATVVAGGGFARVVVGAGCDCLLLVFTLVLVVCVLGLDLDRGGSTRRLVRLGDVPGRRSLRYRSDFRPSLWSWSRRSR